MNKKFQILLGVLVVLFLGYILIPAGQPSNKIQKATDFLPLIENINSNDFEEGVAIRVESKKNAVLEAIASKSEEGWTWVMVGNLFEFVDDYDTAIASYEYAISFGPSMISAQMSLGSIYKSYKVDYEKSISHYKEAIEIDDSIPQPYLDIAQIYEFRLDQSEKAEKILLEGIKTNPSGPQLLTGIIKYYQRQGNIEQATVHAKKLLDFYPDEPQFQPFKKLIQ